MSQAPSMPMFTDALIGDTLHLSIEEFGAYVMLLFATWRNNGQALPNDPVNLARICRISKRQWLSKMSRNVLKFFDTSDGLLHQKRLEKEWARVQERLAVNREKGAAGGRATAANKVRSGGPKSVANVVRGIVEKMRQGVEIPQNGFSRGYSTPSPYPDLEEEENHPHPPESHPARMRANPGRCPSGQRDDEEEVLLEEFKRFWEAYPRKANYHRTFAAFATARKTESAQTLIEAADRYAVSSSGKELRYVARSENWLADLRWLDDPDDGTAEDLNVPLDQNSPDIWRIKMGVWFSKPRDPKSWCEVAWGPPIGDPDCRVPAEVLAEFNCQGGATT